MVSLPNNYTPGPNVCNDYISAFHQSIWPSCVYKLVSAHMVNERSALTCSSHTLVEHV